jgi:putative addiction module component (TIGR02574 family)
MMRAIDIPNFDQLTDRERIALADEILASLKSPEELPPPLAHRAEVDRRWAAYQTDPSIALSDEQFSAQISTLKKLNTG